MKKVLLFIVIAICTLQATAQIPPITWYKTFGSVSEDEGMSIVTDNNGNAYSMSLITHRQDVNTDTQPGDTLFLGRQAEPWTIIQKFDSTGKFIWAKGWRCYNANDVITNRMVIDKSGNIIFMGIAKAGTFSPVITAVDFDPDPTQTYFVPTPPSGQAYDGSYIVKINSNGNLLWVKALTSMSGSFINQRSLAVDDSGNIFSTGTAYGVVNFDPGAGSSVFNTSVFNGFILKLDSNGVYQWAQMHDCTSFNFIRDIATDHAGNCIIIGNNAANTDMDGGSGITTLAAGPYIAKYSGAGTLLWAKPFSSNIYEVKIGNDNSIYAVGDYDNKADMNPDPAVINTIDSVHVFGGYILKLNKDGIYVWSKPIVSKSQFAEKCNIYNIKIDAADNLYLFGTYEGTIDFNPEPPVNALPVSFTGQFIAKYDSAGKYKWAKQLNFYLTSIYSKGLNCDNFGNVFLSGTFGGGTAIDINTTLVSTNITDAFIVKIRGVNATILSLNNNYNLLAEANIYPNPSSGKVYIKSSATIKSAILYNTTGQLIWRYTGNNITSIDLPLAISKGLYQLQLNDDAGSGKLLPLSIQ